MMTKGKWKTKINSKITVGLLSPQPGTIQQRRESACAERGCHLAAATTLPQTTYTQATAPRWKKWCTIT